jgi:flagellar FliL protein
MAEEQKAETESSAGASAKSGSSTSPLVLAILLLNSIGLMALGFFQYSYVKKEAAKPSVVELVKQEMTQHEKHPGDDELVKTKKNEGEMFPLEPFTVNLAQGDGPRRYLRLNTVLQFTTDAKKEELESRKPQIRDTIINILNAKRPEDLLKKEGKVYLKEEIKAAVNSYLINGKLEEVFYTGFQIN